ncbi:MAG: hypothetical protein M1814_006080 [Vezdaea aestivalis]|nr:MAG: hypothetical protein M1814_006080 [Vezdaea aestivalis]
MRLTPLSLSLLALLVSPTLTAPLPSTNNCPHGRLSIPHLRALLTLHNEDGLRADFDNRPQTSTPSRLDPYPTPSLDIDRPLPSIMLLRLPPSERLRSSGGIRSAAVTPVEEIGVEELRECLRSLEDPRAGQRMWNDWVLVVAVGLFLVAILVVEVAQKVGNLCLVALRIQTQPIRLKNDRPETYRDEKLRLVMS